MTWKSYTAASGATLIAGWLASAPPLTGPQSRPAAVPTAAAATRAPAGEAPDIAEQAARLQARVRREAAFARPARNPFEFEARRSPIEAVVPSAAPAAFLAPPAPPAPLVTLAGVAEDQVNEVLVRTAILSSASGVLLVREGDDVLGQYRVSVVEGEAVQLVSLIDGSTLRVAFADAPGP